MSDNPGSPGEIGKAYMRHRSEVQAMARAVAASWFWNTDDARYNASQSRDRFELECREIAHIAAFLVGAVDDELDGRA